LGEAIGVKSISSSELGHSLPDQENLVAPNARASRVAIQGDLAVKMEVEMKNIKYYLKLKRFINERKI
jgi:hypothetical protein